MQPSHCILRVLGLNTQPKNTEERTMGTAASISALKNGTFLVESMSGRPTSYAVKLGEKPSCTCPHFAHRLAAQEGGPGCKHIQAARKEVSRLRWSRYMGSARRLTPERVMHWMRFYADRDPEVYGALVAVWNERKQETRLRGVFA